MIHEEEEQIVARKKRGGSLGEGMQGSSHEQVDGPQTSGLGRSAESF